MSIETDIYDALTDDADVSALVSTRVYPIMAPQSATLPFIVYERGPDSPVIASDGPTGDAECRVDVACVSSTYAQSCDLAGKVLIALGTEWNCDSIEDQYYSLDDDSDTTIKGRKLTFSMFA